jgi:hypothetical protein
MVLRLVALLFWGVFHTAALADDAALCDAAARKASEATGVPLKILMAITRVETGRDRGGGLQPWPWAINHAGEGAWHDTAAQAIAAATAALEDGARNFDVGCFQLNHRWHGDHFPSLAVMFDPETNADYAARFLVQLFADKGTWADAVSAYHSGTEDLATAYLARVKAVVTEDLGGPGVVPPPDIETARENTFPLLNGGQAGTAGSIVPVVLLARPLIGG